MAFHGNRGNSRHRVPGFRGRGNFGHSRGRGRGKPGKLKPVFDSSRILAKNQPSDNEGVPENDATQHENVGELQSEVVSSDESNEDEPVVQPYTALLQSLAVDSKPPAKRRRLDTREAADNENHSSENMTLDASDADNVEELEGELDLETDERTSEDESEAEEPSDPFEAHFAHTNYDSKELKAVQNDQWATLKATLPHIGKAVFSIPGSTEDNKVGFPVPSGPEEFKLKRKLALTLSKQMPMFNSLEKALAPCILHYYDTFFCERSPRNSESLRRLACLHVVNHVFKTRDRVIKNNSRLAKEENGECLELRDQGFTRPKVLILLPTRQSCVKYVNSIISLCEPEQQENRKRFEDSYVEQEGKFSADKPEDFRELFDGNDDDMFRLGIKFTRKTVKYFSQFYNSDLILASPLGLRMAMGSSENGKVEHDFLSSIEIVIVDQTDALLMQNWEHMEFIFENLNLQPKEAHGCDFSRVRSWYLENCAKYFRQNIVFTSFNAPELNTLFWGKSRNWAGKIKFCNIYAGALQELGFKVKQTFSRLDSPSFTTDPDVRFTYFTNAIIPLLMRYSKDNVGTLVFVPSYLDFVRVRNYFATSSATDALSFGCISEYTSVRDVARARSHFLTGRQKVLIYTERAHHFRRYQLRGVKKAIMYDLPDNPLFYKEIVGYLGRSIQEGQLGPGEGKVQVIFSKWDILKLERIAGTERVGKMIREKGDTFDFI